MVKSRILIVEDEWLIGADMQNSLEKMGYDVIAVVTTGEEALKEVKLSKPDLVLMDIILKGKMDGIKTAGKIRSRFDVPVIYVTAHSDKETLNQAKITEPYGYITKPLNMREVSIVIEMALYKHRADRKLKESEEWFSTTLQSIGDAVIAVDTKGTVLFMNPCAQSLTGWREEDVRGRPLKDIVKIINNEDERDDNPVFKVLKEGVPVGLHNHTLIGKDVGGGCILAIVQHLSRILRVMLQAWSWSLAT